MEQNAEPKAATPADPELEELKAIFEAPDDHIHEQELRRATCAIIRRLLARGI